MQKNVRITDGEKANFYSHLFGATTAERLEVVAVGKEQEDGMPRPIMQAHLDYFRRYGAMAETHELNDIIIADGTGIYERSKERSPQKSFIAGAWPFMRANIADLVLGDAYSSEWILYGFAATAYNLCLYYFNCSDTDIRGVIELGRSFSALQMRFELPDERCSVYLGRNRLQTWAPLKRFRQPYMNCQATVSRWVKQDANTWTMKSENFSGTDTLYIDAR